MTSVRSRHRQNANAPISVTLSGMVMLVRLLPKNAYGPIVVTLCGRTTFDTNTLPSNACPPISVMPSGMLIFPMAPFQAINLVPAMIGVIKS